MTDGSSSGDGAVTLLLPFPSPFQGILPAPSAYSSPRYFHLAGSHDQSTHGRGGGGGKSYRQFDNESGYAWHDQHKAWAEGLDKESHAAMSSYYSFGYGDINSALRGTFTRTKTVERLSTPEETEKIREWIKNPNGKAPVPPGHLLASFSLPPFKLSSYVIDVEDRDRALENGRKLDSAIREKGLRIVEPMEVKRASYIPNMTPEQLMASKGSIIVEKAFTSTMVGPADGRVDNYVASGKSESIYNRHFRDYERSTGLVKSGRASDIVEDGVAMKVTIQLPKDTPYIPIEAVRRYSGEFPDPSYRGESEVLLPAGSRFKVVDVKLNVGTSTVGDYSTEFHEVTLEYVD